ncbi:hypothetical protein Csa_019759 [Cucumis sativus]|uniref:Uncharacterized protein n=1 Tax=Cucumis sativus TaxID=3659 RepID=A0A0A0LX46_CUCSA|nr:hypothetical protein Csa_019759 [Cucumis sativus]
MRREKGLFSTHTNCVGGSFPDALSPVARTTSVDPNGDGSPNIVDLTHRSTLQNTSGDSSPTFQTLFPNVVARRKIHTLL